MLVMTLVADVDADVVQQSGILEPLALAIGQAVDPARLVEQGDRQARHLLRVLRPVVAALGELEDAAPAHVGVAIGLDDFLAVPGDVVEHQAFAQRQIAERDLLGAQTLQNRIEQDGAGDGQVCAARFEARHPEPFLEIAFDERFLGAAQLLGRDPPVPERGAGRLVPFGVGDGAQAQYRPRRADDAIEAGAADLIEILAELGVQVSVQLALVARRPADRS